jgi:hypothetical protein
VATDLIITTLDRARTLLAQARDVPAAKQVMDMARAAEVYAKRQKLSEDAIDYAHAVRIDAMALLGEFLANSPKAKGCEHGGRRKIDGTRKEPSNVTPTIAASGISKRDSAESQALAEIKPEGNGFFEEVRGGGKTVSQAVREFRRRRAQRQQEEAAAPPTPPTGADLWHLECADCLDFLKAQSADSIDLVFGSPPYERARLYLEEGRNLGVARDTGTWVAWMVDVYRAALRCCKGLVAFVVEGQTSDYSWSGAPALLMAELHRAGITLRKPPVYRRVGIPGSGGPDWLRNDYELIVCATRGGRLPWSDNTAMGHAPRYEPGGEPSHRQRDGSRVNEPTGYAPAADRGSQGPHRARRRRGRVYHPPERSNPGNVIDCGAVGGGNMGSKLCHQNEAPFPEQLAAFFVRSFCPPGGVVCDPFAGSGTTLAAAVAAGRRATGCDLRRSQVRLASRRLSGVTPALLA